MSSIYAALTPAERMLVCVALGLLAMLLPSSVASWFDERVWRNASVWAKPMKFQLSVAVHVLTIVWAARLLPTRWRQHALPFWLAMFLSAVALFEVLYITLQGARGVASHFNRATALESALGSVMAFGAGVLVSVVFWVGCVHAHRAIKTWFEASGETGNPRERFNVYMSTAIAIGFILGPILAGMTGGSMGEVKGPWPMPLDKAAQSLPFLGWVTTQTDFRIAHFFGLHLMQIVPLTFYITSRFVKSLR